jgi:hypothetical protein
VRRRPVQNQDPGLGGRLALAVLLVLASIVLLAVSVPTILVGYAEMRVARLTYQVEFVHGTGDDCDGAHGLYLRVADGEPLFCQPATVSGGAVDLPGFTDGQVDEVTRLAKQVGADGL